MPRITACDICLMDIDSFTSFRRFVHSPRDCRPLLHLHPEPRDTNEAIEGKVVDMSPGGTVSGMARVGGPKAVQHHSNIPCPRPPFPKEMHPNRPARHGAL